MCDKLLRNPAFIDRNVIVVKQSLNRNRHLISPEFVTHGRAHVFKTAYELKTAYEISIELALELILGTDRPHVYVVCMYTLYILWKFRANMNSVLI